MKKLLFLFLLLPLCSRASNIQQIVPPKDEAETRTVSQCPNCRQSDSGNFLFQCGEYQREEESESNGFFPGLVNLGTCWLEVPRAFTYEATARPRSIIVLAPLIGASLTGLRALQGAGNVLTLGLCDKFIRGDMPRYVWDALWLAREPESD